MKKKSLHNPQKFIIYLINLKTEEDNIKFTLEEDLSEFKRSFIILTKG